MSTPRRRRFPLWLQAVLALLVFLASQHLTVWTKEKAIRDAHAATATQKAVVRLGDEMRPVTLEGLNAACFEKVMQRSRSEELWLRLGSTAMLLGQVPSYQVHAGDLTPPKDAGVCQRLRQLEGTF
ncbi:hypothetical protein ACINK0_18795 (plasmid) [Deinococcus sp. VB343]|uniref:Uncharacterized protein n=1 Tax=Deinococcus sp. VB142 TaxID=3112952 RepID=A0AAU6Q7R4_9DEIO